MGKTEMTDHAESNIGGRTASPPGGIDSHQIRLEVTVYNELRGQLASLKELSAEKKFDYEDSAGNKAARSHVYLLRRSKAAVEVIRKDSKAASIAYGKRVDAEAGDITTEIQTMIEVHTGPLQAIELRETERKARHEMRIAALRESAEQARTMWMELPLETMQDFLSASEDGKINPDAWEEYADEAQQARDETVAALRDAIDKRETYDGEQAELARLRAEADAREAQDAIERQQREEDARAEEAAQRAREDERRHADAEALADRAKWERELQAERDRSEREKAEAETAKAEAEARAANAEREGREQAERNATQAARKADQQRQEREADREHRATINRHARAALVTGGLSEHDAETAITLIAQQLVPNVRVNY